MIFIQQLAFSLAPFMGSVLLHGTGHYTAGITKFTEDKQRVTDRTASGMRTKMRLPVFNQDLAKYRSLKIAFYCVTAVKSTYIIYFI